ncbi:hypothetical protein GCM10007938_38440 [Vibrio zhanjiangensis]|uniref:Uncharacterized protein n=1 Tax=Vibrio zhanjiangensis TaxID=1046128 RepID=A0ABQ6F4A5_9VIBR|nr:hypothetical protein [Vibrio zhanjiangensis]GLT20061.1 hypothetical protein GCM10007938_38440 [Vibrio zhanjiangensis]
MIQRFIALLCWIALIALALPSQAMSYLAEYSKHDSSRFGQSSYSNVTANALLTKSTQSKVPTPTRLSKYNTDVDLLNITQLSRHKSSVRDDNDAEGERFGDGYSLDKLTKVFSAHRLYFSSQNGRQIGADFNSQYRISGWKESNALYVALNGHFS